MKKLILIISFIISLNGFSSYVQSNASSGGNDPRISSSNLNQWNDAYSKEHVHANKGAIDTLSNNNFSTWNSKQAALGFTPEYQLTFSSPFSRNSNTVSIPLASAGVSGYIDNANFNIFNTSLNYDYPVNLISNGSFLFDTRNWTAQTGLTIQRSTVFGSPASALITKDGQNRLGSYISIPLKPLAFDYQNYVLTFNALSNQNTVIYDFYVIVHDVTANTDLTYTVFAGTGGDTVAYGSFNNGGHSYELRIQVNTTTTGIQSFYITNIKLESGAKSAFTLTAKGVYSDTFGFNAGYVQNGVMFSDQYGTVSQDTNFNYQSSMLTIPGITINDLYLKSSAAAPNNTSTPAVWFNANINGQVYKIPGYQ